jgi:hypothetical protein
VQFPPKPVPACSNLQCPMVGKGKAATSHAQANHWPSSSSRNSRRRPTFRAFALCPIKMAGEWFGARMRLLTMRGGAANFLVMRKRQLKNTARSAVCLMRSFRVAQVGLGRAQRSETLLLLLLRRNSRIFGRVRPAFLRCGKNRTSPCRIGQIPRPARFSAVQK